MVFQGLLFTRLPLFHRVIDKEGGDEAKRALALGFWAITSGNAIQYPPLMKMSPCFSLVVKGTVPLILVIV
jgi:hypothetical protein